MVAKDFVRGFRRFLRQASTEELRARHAAVVRDLPQLTDPEVIRDGNYLLRLLEEALRERMFSRPSR